MILKLVKSIAFNQQYRANINIERPESLLSDILRLVWSELINQFVPSTFCLFCFHWYTFPKHVTSRL